MLIAAARAEESAEKTVDSMSRAEKLALEKAAPKA